MSVFTTPESAEAAFYLAFSECSLQSMDRVWGQGDVVCIHPGAKELVGRNAVLKSWARILTAAHSVTLRYEMVSKTCHDELAVHIVREWLGDDPENGPVCVLATNVFEKKNDEWHIIEHHGSPSIIDRPMAKRSHSSSTRVLQ